MAYEVRCEQGSASVVPGGQRLDVEDEQRRIGTRPHTVGENFALELPLLGLCVIGDAAGWSW